MRIPAVGRILAGLIAGLALCYWAGPQNAALPALQAIGGPWLEALRMPIIPLVFALVITGLGSGSGSGGSSRVARRAIGAFVLFLSASALFGVALGSAIFSGWQVTGLDAVRATGTRVPDLPPLGETLRALVPVNPIASGAQEAIVPVVLFALFFAIALRHIDRSRAASIVHAFQGIADALLVIIGWVLLVAPVGVLALAFDVAARSGFAVGALLLWYVVARVVGGIVLLAAFVILVAVAARTRLRAFLRAVLPAQ